MAHHHLDLLRKMDEAMAAGDLPTFFGSYTDDVIVHIGGKSKLAGDYHGIQELQQMFGKFMEASGEYSFENHTYMADDGHGVILQRGTFKRDGRSVSTNEAFVIHFRDGKISEFWYQPFDQAAVDDWWATQ